MFTVPPLATRDPTTPTYKYQVLRIFLCLMHLPGFELDTSRLLVLLHLHLTTQAIVAKHRIFLVVISYWSQTRLAKTLIYSYLGGYLVHGLLFFCSQTLISKWPRVQMKQYFTRNWMP